MSLNKRYDTVEQKISYSTSSIDSQNILSIIEKASNFEKNINKKILEFEKQGINISTCSVYFEKMIDEHMAKLLNKLETAHAHNMRLIERLFRQRASVKVELENSLQRLEIEIAKTEAEFDSLKKFADEMNPLKNGRLTSEEISVSSKKQFGDMSRED